MSSFTELVRLASLGAAGMVALQVVEMYKAETPEAHSTELKRWAYSNQAPTYSNGSKSPIKDVKRVGPSSYVITHHAGYTSLVHTHNIDRHIKQRYYYASEFKDEHLHPQWTKNVRFN